jgi:hypothetical protein
MGLKATLVGCGVLLAVAGLACGGDSGGGGGGGGGSYAAIVNNLDHPTGKLDKSNAVSVADGFQKLQESGVPAGERHAAQSGETTMQCPAGGSVTVHASGNESAAHGSYSYNDCCYEASCCYKGDGTFYFSNEQGATYTQCLDFNIVLTCGDAPDNVDYSYCMDSTGQPVFSVEVSGKTYTVSGQYSNGSGTLTIKDSSGSWTCTYNNSTGSCTGDGGTLDF